MEALQTDEQITPITTIKRHGAAAGRVRHRPRSLKTAGVEVRSSPGTSTSTRNPRPTPTHPHSTRKSQFPRAIESVLNNLHQADSKSTEFRYGIQTDIDPSYIDSASLCKELSEQFHKLEIVIDYAYGTAKDRYTTHRQNDLTAQVDIALTATDTISRNIKTPSGASGDDNSQLVTIHRRPEGGVNGW